MAGERDGVKLASMYRGALTFVLSFFLLFMQQESVRHALDHLGAQLQRIEHSALERPTGDHCFECDLLGSSTASAPPAAVHHRVEAAKWTDPVAPVGHSPSGRPSHYRSRAPPLTPQNA